MSGVASAQGRRRVRPLNRGWRYGGPVDRLPPGYTQPECDDSAFEPVAIPHTNVRLPWHSFDDREYQFISVYRNRFTVPDVLRDRRLFVDFDGVMTASTVWLNGHRLGEYRGGYTPFSFELTPHVRWGGENVLAVEVDSRERPDIPPFGGRIDYLTFGGIYRDVRLRAVPEPFIENVFARPGDVLSERPRLEVRCFVEGQGGWAGLALEAELCDGDRALRCAVVDLGAPGARATGQPVIVELEDLGLIERWDIDHPKLYRVIVRLRCGEEVLDAYVVRTGFREARFTPQGFFLNGRHIKLRGLNRHQTFPYVGQAMPARVQRRDAEILKCELKCNIVRTSHYPQSPHFLDACDELGLLVFEEIPGWQHIGDQEWKELACRNVAEMIRRDWNHPSIILWGVRINESRDDHDFYTRTNAIAHALDDSRQTGGVRNFYDSELLEDVFTMNDFNPERLRPPNHPLYLNTEFCGHMYPTKHVDNVERVQEHVRRHAHIHNQIASDVRYAGGIGWCAFDYNTHADFGSGDRVCYHGVADIFRISKPAAGFYRSQCDPSEELVLEPAFHWAIGDQSEGGGPRPLIICSNCEHLKLYVGGELRAELDPDREHFGHLPHPPFVTDRLQGVWGRAWQDLRIDGYLGGQKVISRTLSAAGVDRQLHVEPDDRELIGDGSDATRLVLRVTDEYGNPRPFATGAIALALEGPGELIGENPLALFGGVGAVWIRAQEQPGIICVRARHPVLGEQVVEIRVTPAPDESWC